MLALLVAHNNDTLLHKTIKMLLMSSCATATLHSAITRQMLAALWGEPEICQHVIGNSITVTDSSPVDTDFDSKLLQHDIINTSSAGTTSNQQETSYISDDATGSSVPVKATLWCYCQHDKPYRLVVGCDNPTCRIEWFHLSCLQLTVEQLPRGHGFAQSVTNHDHN